MLNDDICDQVLHAQESLYVQITDIILKPMMGMVHINLHCSALWSVYMAALYRVATE